MNGPTTNGQKKETKPTIQKNVPISNFQQPTDTVTLEKPANAR